MSTTRATAEPRSHPAFRVQSRHTQLSKNGGDIDDRVIARFADSNRDRRQLALAAAAGLASAFALARTLPLAIDAASAIGDTLCSVSSPLSSPLDKVELILPHALPNVPGKRVTIVRLTYGPGGFTRPHRHAGSVTAYITKSEVRSQLGGGPLETFTVGQSFFEPPGATHLVSANASSTEPAELIAVFVADEGAQLTTYLE